MDASATEELLVLAIEVLVYTTKHLTTIFISKADSTGYLSLIGPRASQAASPLKAICGTFVSWLGKRRQREGIKVVVSLFARAQNQYLFAGSAENSAKHVLDDRGLVKWWCKVLDPLLHEYEEEEPPKMLDDRLAPGDESVLSCARLSTSRTAKGYLIVPGFEPYDTLRFTPPPSPSTATRRWAATHPLLQIAPHPGAPPRCLIPHFPDDPKARFLDELDEELPDRGSDATAVEGGTPSRSNGQWKSVKTLDQFWEFMAFRQECSSGRLVGFIWVVIKPPRLIMSEGDVNEPPHYSSYSQVDSQSTAAPSLPSSSKKKKEKRKNVAKAKRSKRRNLNTEQGQIPIVIPRIISASSKPSAMSTISGGAESSAYFVWPIDSRGSIVFSSKDYVRAHEVLLSQVFSTRAAAAKSTRKWKEEVAVLGGIGGTSAVGDWSQLVVGQKDIPYSNDTVTDDVMTGGTAIEARRKRKPDTLSEPQKPTVLAGGLVRKKARVEPLVVECMPSHNDGVNTLESSLVRKKQKN